MCHAGSDGRTERRRHPGRAGAQRIAAREGRCVASHRAVVTATPKVRVPGNTPHEHGRDAKTAELKEEGDESELRHSENNLELDKRKRAARKILLNDPAVEEDVSGDTQGGLPGTERPRRTEPIHGV